MFDYNMFVDFYNANYSSKITLDDIYRAIPAENFDDENEFGVYDSFVDFPVNYKGKEYIVLIHRGKPEERSDEGNDTEEDLPEPF